MWRRLLGKLAPYPRVQLFKEKIKIRKLHEDTWDTCKYGATLPPNCKRGATFSMRYENRGEWAHFGFDVYITNDGEIRVFIPEADMKKVVSLAQLKVI